MVNLLDLKFQNKLDLGGSKAIPLRPFDVDRPEDFGKQLISVVRQTGHDNLLKLPGVAYIRISRNDYAEGLATIVGADSTLITRDYGRYSTPAVVMRQNIMRPTPRPNTGADPSSAAETPSKHAFGKEKDESFDRDHVSLSSSSASSDSSSHGRYGVPDPYSNPYSGLPYAPADSTLKEAVKLPLMEWIARKHDERVGELPPNAQMSILRSEHRALANHALGDALLERETSDLYVYIDVVTGRPESNSMAYIRYAIDDAVRRAAKSYLYLIDGIPKGEIRLLYDTLMSVKQQNLSAERQVLLQKYNTHFKGTGVNFTQWSMKFYDIVQDLRALGMSINDEMASEQLQVLLKESDKRYSKPLKDLRHEPAPPSYAHVIQTLKIHAIEIGDIPKSHRRMDHANALDDYVPHSSGEMCKHYLEHKKCRWGSKCRHLHQSPTQAANNCAEDDDGSDTDEQKARIDSDDDDQQAYQVNTNADCKYGAKDTALVSGIKPTGKTRPSGTRAIRVCYQYADTGKCRFGDKCKFSHKHLKSDHANYTLEKIDVPVAGYLRVGRSAKAQYEEDLDSESSS